MIRILILINCLCLSLNAQENIRVSDTYTLNGRLNGIIELDNGNLILSGYKMVQEGFLHRAVASCLSIVDENGQNIDSLSYPEFKMIKVISQRENGRVLCIAETVDGFRFVTTDRNMTNPILSKKLLLSPDINISNILDVEIESDHINLLIYGFYDSLRNFRLIYDKTTLQLIELRDVCVSKYEFPENECYFCQEDTDSTSHLTKYDLNGNKIWKRDFSSYGISDMVMNDKDEIYIAGNYATIPDDKYNAVIALFDPIGNWITQKSVTVESAPQFWNFRLHYQKLIIVNGNILAVGLDNYKTLGRDGQHNLIAGYYDEQLSEIDFNRYSLGGIHSGIADIFVGEDNNIHGVINSANYHSTNSYYFKVNLMELTSSNEIDESQVGIYPNPTNDLLHINYPKDIQNIQIHNTNGEQVHILKEVKMLDVSTLPAGSYFMSFQKGDDRIVRKFIKTN